MKYPVLCVAALVIFALTTWWRLSVWQECRADHSWSYCFVVLGK